MLLQNSPYIYPLLLSAFITALLGLYAWRRRHVAMGAPAFAAFMLAAAVWALASALGWASAQATWQLLWLRVTYLGIVAVPVGWFRFGLIYTGRGRWLTKRVERLLWLVPMITTLLLWTNASHRLMFSSIESSSAGGYTFLQSDYGLWFWWGHSAYSYLLLLAGTLLLFEALARSPRTYRGQAGGLLWGVLTPWVINGLNLAGLIPLPHVDLTPFTFALSGLFFAWALFRYKLLLVVPVAHETVIQNLDEPVAVLDARNNVVNINPAALRLLGQAGKDASGQPASELFARWPSLLEHFARPGDQRTDVMLSLDAGERPYHLRLTTVKGQDGSNMGRLMLLQDIARTKQTEAALEQSEKSYYAIVEGMGDPYFEADRAGTVTYANQAFCANIGRARSDVVGHNFRRFTHRAYIKNVWEYFSRAYTHGPPSQPLEYVFRRGDGTMRLAELTLSMIHVSDGQPVGTRGILRDITERRQAEQALQRAKEAAEEASQAKSAFLANVSHELRTPLTSVLGFAKIIRKRLHEQVFPQVAEPDRRTQRAMEQVSANLDIIVTESERLTTLINDVLDLTKIEAGKEEWHMQPLSVPAVLEQAMNATASLFEGKKLQLSGDIDLMLPPVIGDRDRLVQVAINLLSNAVKFTDQGTITCRARLGRGKVVVSVIDSGIGIAPEDHGKVFELFTQVGDTLTDKPKGTGLGLPICKQIIEHHGGRIWVESEPGRGSTFSFSLPMAAGEAPVEEAAAEAVAEPAAPLDQALAGEI